MDYASLTSTLQTWLARADLSADTDSMIAFFEGWANTNLRVQQMEVEATTQAQEYLPLPTDFQELRDIQWQGTPRIQLEYLTPMMSDKVDPCGSAGTPRYYTIVGDQLRLVPAPSDTTTNIRIAYWRRIPALSSSNTTNWLLDYRPDAYLYGALIHGNVRIKDNDMAAAVTQGWSSIMADLQRSGKNANLGSSLRVRISPARVV